MPQPAPLPFEDITKGFWPRVSLTLTQAFTDPMGAFEALPRGSSLWAPWRLKLLCMAPAYLCLVLLLGLMHLVVVVTALVESVPLNQQALLVFPGLLLAVLVGGPLLQLGTMLAGGAILHAFLWAFRGTRSAAGLRPTVRALGYTQAVTGLFCLLPPLVPLAYPASRVALGLGLARMHRTQPWRGVAAALTQAFLTGLIILALLMSLVVWMVRQDQRSRQISLPDPDILQLPEEPPPDRI
jgi:hypothetical protein